MERCQQILTIAIALLKSHDFAVNFWIMFKCGDEQKQQINTA